MSYQFAIPGFEKGRHTTEDGVKVVHNFLVCGDRYRFDARHCRAETGWVQYDTKQDAWYFGIWVRPQTFEIVEYAEGDIYHSTAPDEETFKKLLEQMAEFYGPPPPAAIAIDDDGTITEFYDERPT